MPYPLPKRLLDKTAASALLVLLAPLFVVALGGLAIDMLIAPRDRGSFFYREPRVSRGRTFGLLKFRTLRADVLATAAGHARLLEHDPDNLTWIGAHMLKPWYLDELPQLLNVLLGDLSLVGPRPWPPALVERQVAEGLDYRLEIIAGLTGPAQVTKGDASSSYAELDLGYVEAYRTQRGWPLVRNDLRILAQTLRVIARREGLNY